MLLQCVVFPEFTTMDLVGALQPLALIPNIDIEIVAQVRGEVPTDCQLPIVAASDFVSSSKTPDILLVPGGGPPAIKALENDALVDFVAEQGAAAQWIIGVCTGSLILGCAGLLKGYKAASHWGAIDTLSAFGAEVVHERVVIDRNRCTGGGVTASVDIGISMLAVLVDDDFGRLGELSLEYNPAPPFGTGHPALCGEELLGIAKPLMEAGMPMNRIHQAAKVSRQRLGF